MDPICKTCGKLFADIDVEYTSKLSLIENNQALSEEEKNKKKIELINSLGLKRYCCRMRFISFINKVEIMI